MSDDKIATIEKIVKQYGRKREVKHIERLFPGSFVLAKEIGGGWPKGRVSELWGEPGTGKSTIALLTAKHVLDNGGRVAYIDLEKSIEAGWLEDLGIDYEMYVENGQLVVIDADVSEDYMQLCIELIKQDFFDLVVFDSLGEVNSSEALEKKIGESERLGRNATLIQQFIKNAKIHMGLCVDTNPVLLLINQSRQVIASGPNYGLDIKTPGGEFHKFAASLILRTMPIKDDLSGSAKNDDVSELHIRIKIQKTKVGTFHKREIDVVLRRNKSGFGMSIAYPDEFFELAKDAGMFRTGTGAVYVSSGAINLPMPDGSVVELSKKKQDDAKVAIANNREVFSYLAGVFTGQIEPYTPPQEEPKQDEEEPEGVAVPE